MNERIKALAFQAMSINQKVSDDSFFVEVSKLKEFEKFAELLVRECEKVAKDGNWYYDAPSCGWRNPINHVCNEMKQHFGVEE